MSNWKTKEATTKQLAKLKWILENTNRKPIIEEYLRIHYPEANLGEMKITRGVAQKLINKFDPPRTVYGVAGRDVKF